MVNATIRMMIPNERFRQALKILTRMAERTSVEQGCLSCRIYQDLQEEHVILLEEIWIGEEEFEQHLCSDHFHDVLLVMEMASYPPEAQFRSISRVAGLERVEEARGSLGRNAD